MFPAGTAYVEALDLARVLWFFGPAYAADLSPILARELFPRLDAPLDGGLTIGGRPVLGSHKTWRGFLAGVLAGIVTWEAQSWLYAADVLRELALVDYGAHPFLPGLLMGAGALTGDAAKSFLKRRVGIAPGATWLGFDQLDFFAGAAAAVSLAIPLPPWPLLLAVPIVFLCDILATTILSWIGWKESWI